MRSKLGIILAVTYGLVSVVIFGYAMLCSGLFCGLIILAPIMPWPFLAEIFGFPALFNSMFGAVVFAFINAGLLYWLGSIIEKYRSRSITDKV